MWNKIIFIDYDVGSFGNTILTLLVTTSQSALGAIEYTSLFSDAGDSHSIRKQYKYSMYEYQPEKRPLRLDPMLIDSTKFVPIIGHSYGQIESIMEQYIGANLIRIASDRRTFALTFLAGCGKFTGYPTVANMGEFYKDSWACMEQNEAGMVECLAMNFHHYISTVDWQFYKNSIVLSLSEIIDSNFTSITKLFEEKFSFEFDYTKVDDFVNNWKTANQSYIDNAIKIEEIVSAIKTNTSLDISKMNWYEHALIVAFVCFDLGLDIKKYPFTDSFNTGWKNTNQISKLIFNTKDIYHGKTI